MLTLKKINYFTKLLMVYGVGNAKLLKDYFLQDLREKLCITVKTIL